ncbi:hypothetical protein HanRHA438_Chr10g0459091 [Helianthus annuus]|nr:hypothetical protein HanRHA438_Chr10g0459091 [Helianthus annuus]
MREKERVIGFGNNKCTIMYPKGTCDFFCRTEVMLILLVYDDHSTVDLEVKFLALWKRRALVPLMPRRDSARFLKPMAYNTVNLS